MTSRERVLATFEGEKPDRVPQDLGSTIWTTMDGTSYGHLKHYLGVASETHYKNVAFRAVEVDEDILLRLGIDTRGLTTKGPAGWQDEISPEGIYIDEWGIHRDVKASAAIVEHPFSANDFSHQFLEEYKWPDGTDVGRFEGFQDILSRWHAEREYATVLNIFGGFTTMSYLLRGMDNWCLDMLAEEDLFTDLLDRTLKFEMDSARTALTALGKYVDIVGIADDFAGQDGLFFSPGHFRRFIKPRMEKLIGVIRECCDSRILFHSCGSVVDIIPDLIELGIDGLNPFQVTARGMDPDSLGKLYRGKIVFWGGIDTQQLMPKGTPEAVAGEVKRIFQAMNGEGYVLGAVHNIQGDVPPENVIALFGQQ